MNAGRASRSARYRPERKRRPRTPILVLLSALIAGTLLVALGAREMMARAWCASHPVVAHVVAAGEIAPAVQHVADYFNRQHRVVSGHCTQIAVRTAASGVIAAQLSAAPRASGQAPVDAWIPDSVLWPGLVGSTPAGASRVRVIGPSIAHTPLVIVMPRSAAARMPAFGTSVSWRFLLAPQAGGPSSALGLHVQFPDPTQSGAGLSALIQLRQMFGQSPAARTRLARFVFHVQVVPAPAGNAPLTALAAPAPAGHAPSEPVTIIAEQEAITFDRAHPRQPLAVRYPAEGTEELTFPYVLTASDPLTRAVAERFGTLLRSPYATAYVRYLGFRSGAAPIADWPAWYGLRAREPRLLPAPLADQAGLALREWRQLTLGSRDLALIDVSGAMARRTGPGGPTLEQMLGRAAGLGLARLPDSTQMGLWSFASQLNGGLAYRQLVPLGPLPGPFGLVTRRQAISHMAVTERAMPHVPADLYGAILAAYRHVLSTYQPQYVNAVVVLTAGVNDAPGGISAGALVRDLRALADSRRPVNIVIIMVGKSGDFASLQRIAATTGGQAADITSAAQIRRVFYVAMSRRLCQPHCAG